MAGKYNFSIEQGTDFSRVITWRDQANVLINLTGYTARLQAREKIADTATLIDLSVGAGIALGGTLGTITLSMTAAQTTALNFVTAVYNLEMTSPTGKISRLLEGYVRLSREVSR